MLYPVICHFTCSDVTTDSSRGCLFFLLKSNLSLLFRNYLVELQENWSISIAGTIDWKIVMR